MSRSRLMFLVIVGAALVVVLAGVLMDRLGQQDSDGDAGGANGSAGKGPIEITVAVSPLAVEWFEDAVQSYNGRRHQVDGRVVEIKLEIQDSLPIWSAPGKWTTVSHPLVWIPEMSAAVEYANEVGLRFSVLHPSLASTVMMWGAPADRAQAIERQYSGLNWDSIQQASTVSLWEEMGGQAEWGRFFKPGFAQPDRYTSGMAALLVAAAEFHNQAALDTSVLDDPNLKERLKPVIESVPSFAALGAHPAETIAARGASVADVALLPESEWLANYRGLTSKVGPLAFDYPVYQFWFDFPYTVWDGAEVTPQERTAAQDFLNFLLSDDQQRRAANVGLRQADGIPAASTLFDQAVGAGVLAGKPVGEPIQLPTTRSDLLSFVNRNWTAF
jgi:hypothetical protein